MLIFSIIVKIKLFRISHYHRVIIVVGGVGGDPPSISPYHRVIIVGGGVGGGSPLYSVNPDVRMSEWQKVS